MYDTVYTERHVTDQLVHFLTIIIVHKSTLLMTSYTYETRGSRRETKVNISMTQN